jgi:CRP-like cAMP-binding protein
VISLLVHVVAAAILKYIGESRDSLFTEQAYNAFISSGQCTNASVTNLLKQSSPQQLTILQRVVMMLDAVANVTTADKTQIDQTRHVLAKACATSVIRLPGASAEHNTATVSLRENALFLLISQRASLLPNQYHGSATRVGQALHYKPRLLRANELAILTEGAEQRTYSAGSVAIEDNTQNSFIYRVIEGTFSVFVGKTKVATLVTGDWFGEMSLLGNTFSRAKVVAEKKSTAVRISDVKLNAVLLSRPDLATTFYSVLAFDLASRLNVALLQSTRSLANPENVAIDPNLGMHASRTLVETRAQVKFCGRCS